MTTVVPTIAFARGFGGFHDGGYRGDLMLRGDLAGFGVNGDDLTWTVTGLAVWRAWEKTDPRFGYRIYDIGYSDGSGSDEFGYDVRMQGPYIGLSHQF